MSMPDFEENNDVNVEELEGFTKVAYEKFEELASQVEGSTDEINSIVERIDHLRESMEVENESLRIATKGYDAIVTQLRGLYQTLTAMGITPKMPEVANITRKGAPNTKLAHTFADVAKRHGKPVIHYKELMELLDSEGKLPKAKYPETNILAHLSRSPEAWESLGDGMYQVKI